MDLDNEISKLKREMAELQQHRQRVMHSGEHEGLAEITKKVEELGAIVHEFGGVLHQLNLRVEHLEGIGNAHDEQAELVTFDATASAGSPAVDTGATAAAENSSGDQSGPTGGSDGNH